jgi:hypothetical protein
VVQQSFRLDKDTAGGRFVVRVLGTRSADNDGGSAPLPVSLVCQAAGRSFAQ